MGHNRLLFLPDIAIGLPKFVSEEQAESIDQLSEALETKYILMVRCTAIAKL